MKSLTLLERPDVVEWHYDAEADVLYLSLGEPQPAIGIAIGDGTVLRYDESKGQVVGITIIGLRERLVKELLPAAD